VLAPALWLFTTVFAAGLLSVLWRAGSDQGAWALVGFAGILLGHLDRGLQHHPAAARSEPCRSFAAYLPLW